MKLHLGCGQRYLEGYINIDLPTSEQTVQLKVVADQHLDIQNLSYPINTIKEVRLHHVLEHFTRPIAFALISGWHAWLKEEGILHIEVPDVYRQMFTIINPFGSEHSRCVAIRHLFGSHEASWAVHCEGYTQGMLQNILESYGFVIEDKRTNQWKGTYNFEIIAKKKNKTYSQKEYMKITENLFLNYLVDELERPLVQVWLKLYCAQLTKLGIK